MTIRTAKNSDIPQIRSLVASLKHFYLQDSDSQLPQWFEDTLTVQAYENRIESTEYQHYIYEQGGNVIAYIAIKGNNYLYHLFVAADKQGQGLSRQLWEYVVSINPQSDYSLRSSLYAVPVYKQFGFVESGKIGVKDGICFQPMQLKSKHSSS